MNKKITGGLIALISSLVLLVAVPTAAAGDTPCTTVLPAGTYDNIVVPPGAFCQIQNSTVNGNVKALENSQLTIIDSTVRGNVEGDKADVVQVLDTSLFPAGSLIGGNFEAKEGNFFARVCGTTLPGGNIQVEKFRPDATNTNTYVLIGGPSFCGGLGGGNTLLKGNIKVEENMVAGFGELHVDQNSVAEDLQVFKNTGGPTDTKTVQNNTVGESIQCKENSLPFIGGPNTAPKKEDQCF